MKQDTLTPVWNEIWRVKNVPVTADLVIKVMDKDQGSMTDDFIGRVTTSISAGAKEADIEGSLFRRSRGTFWLKVRHIFLPTTLFSFSNLLLDRLHAGSGRGSYGTHLPLQRPHPLLAALLAHSRSTNQPKRRSPLLDMEDVHHGGTPLFRRRPPTLE